MNRRISVSILPMILLAAVFIIPGNAAGQVRSTSAVSSTFCFNTNLRIGDRGVAVGRLQAILEKEGFSFADEDRGQRDREVASTFGESTASAVVGFQEKYTSEILTPNGLARGTGYVGPSTRAKLNQLSGCAPTTVVNIPTTPNMPTQSLPPTSPLSDCYFYGRNLTLGSTGDDVVALQSLLIRKGFNIPAISEGRVAKGYFGGATAVALGRFQQSSLGISENGYFGPLTRAKLNASCSRTDTPPISRGDVKVLGPNGGESYATGDTVHITWTTGNNSAEKVRIALTYTHTDPTYPAGTNFEDWIIESTPNTGSYDWVIPEYYATGVVASSFRVSVKANNQIDDSDSTFTIRQGVNRQSLTVEKPLAGSSFSTGSIAPVSWNQTQNVSYSAVLLRQGDATFSRIIWLVDQNSWKVPQDIPAGNNYVIKVSEGRNKTGYSGAFSITNSGQTVSLTSKVNVLSPRHGEVWKVGQTYQIKWNTEGTHSTNANIYLAGLNSVRKLIAQVPYSNGVFNYNVPEADLTGYAWFIICDTDGSCSNSGTSGSISIVSASTVTNSGVSVSAYLADASSDKVGSGFDQSVGINNNNPADWHWKATITSNNHRSIKEIYIKSNTAGEAWSTTNNVSIIGTGPYPIQAYYGNTRLNTAYDQVLPVNVNGTLTLDLYGQPETTPFYGGTITVTFTDGTYATGVIPGSSIMQATGVSCTTNDSRCATAIITRNSIKVLSPNGGESFTSDQQISIGFMGSAGQRTSINLIDSSGAGYALISFNNYNYHNIPDPYYPATGGGLYDSVAKLYVPKNWINEHGSQYKIEICSGVNCDKSDAYFTVSSPVLTSVVCPIDSLCYPPGTSARCPEGASCTSFTQDCPTGYTCLKPSMTVTVGAQVASASYDKVGFSTFTPGSGRVSKIPSDWNWKLILMAEYGTPSETRKIKSVTIYHTNYQEGWSTSASSDNKYGMPLYPLRVVSQSWGNTAYDQDMPFVLSQSSPRLDLDLYGQIETTYFTGGTIVVTFTDGTSISARIPSSSIQPVNTTSQTGSALNAFRVYQGGEVISW